MRYYLPRKSWRRVALRLASTVIGPSNSSPWSGTLIGLIANPLALTPDVWIEDIVPPSYAGYTPFGLSGTLLTHLFFNDYWETRKRVITHFEFFLPTPGEQATLYGWYVWSVTQEFLSIALFDEPIIFAVEGTAIEVVAHSVIGPMVATPPAGFGPYR
jgi:hypothetical protein